jgi:hypothetical protein
MDWASFIPSVVAGAVAGLFIARASFWKRQYKDQRDRHASLAKQHVMDRIDHDRTVQEWADALSEAQRQNAAAKTYAATYAQGQVGMQHHSQPMAMPETQFTDEALQKILTDLSAHPKTHVIEEEP